jgi:hypothetical protein
LTEIVVALASEQLVEKKSTIAPVLRLINYVAGKESIATSLYGSYVYDHVSIGSVDNPSSRLYNDFREKEFNSRALSMKKRRGIKIPFQLQGLQLDELKDQVDDPDMPEEIRPEDDERDAWDEEAVEPGTGPVYEEERDDDDIYNGEEEALVNEDGDEIAYDDVIEE